MGVKKGKIQCRTTKRRYVTIQEEQHQRVVSERSEIPEALSGIVARPYILIHPVVKGDKSMKMEPL
jgi:hypothetical protein